MRKARRGWLVAEPLARRQAAAPQTVADVAASPLPPEPPSNRPLAVSQRADSVAANRVPKPTSTGTTAKGGDAAPADQPEQCVDCGRGKEAAHSRREDEKARDDRAMPRRRQFDYHRRRRRERRTEAKPDEKPQHRKQHPGAIGDHRDRRPPIAQMKVPPTTIALRPHRSPSAPPASEPTIAPMPPPSKMAAAAP